ncbi:hypothetical protein NBT05_00460 [Aquimarina sp. ERC-38]|uniref:DUF7033 domain-containing protein n=1 Tax=Aquimarina sp. ERC-38 TaxID=2949996 RepID=UPI0022480B4B|nr:hypothetical protein [Aquimarina sp. ERC-38]UZO80970.1 hypothetical protein NBT05_00460 [Aquimarina sp. ERC-38]
MLGIPVSFTSRIEEFIAFEGAKFSYGKHPLGKELYFQSIPLLFDRGFNEIEVDVKDWDHIKGIFPVVHKDAAVPFDIFAGTFYLLSRYEEYFPHRKDAYGRFIAEESLAYTYHFLEIPIVDFWVQKFKEILKEYFPKLQFHHNRFSIKPSIIVSQTFAYAQKGIIRTLGGVGKDLFKGRIRNILSRFQVLLNLKEDPYDTFNFLIELQKIKKKQATIFFSLGDYSNYEKNILFNNEKHKNLIKHVSDYLQVGSKVSMDAITELALIKKEKRRLESIIHRPVQEVICSYFKINLPDVYRMFIELEVFEDFSMGYAKHMGFRAGTCTPFLFYDLDYEIQTPLKIYPFSLTPKNFKGEVTSKDIMAKIDTMVHHIKSVEGTFIPVLSNGLLNGQNPNRDWKQIATYIWNLNE